MEGMYVKTSNDKFFLSKCIRWMNFNEMIEFIDDNDETLLAIPLYDVEYFFKCNENRYNTLNSDLKRGCVML